MEDFGPPRWSLLDTAVVGRDAVRWDVDGDGTAEIVFGGLDSFLFVVDPRNGHLQQSRSVGAPITALAVVPAGRLAVGTADGSLILLDADLSPIARTKVGDAEVRCVTVLERPTGRRTIVAADETGLAVWVAID